MRINGSNNNFIWQSKPADTTDAPNKGWSADRLSDIPAAEEKTPSEAELKARKKAMEERQKYEKMQNSFEDAMRQLENAREQGKAMADAMETRMKCLQIAMNIICGDDVPPEDYRYLAENDISLYGKAIMMRIQKENPEKKDRISEDEDSDSSAEGNSRGETNPPSENGKIKIKAQKSGASTPPSNTNPETADSS